VYPKDPISAKTTHVNEVVKLLIHKISSEWPQIEEQDQDPDLELGYHQLASVSSFTKLLKHNLTRLINIEKNAENTNEILLQKMHTLQKGLETEVSECISNFIYSSFTHNWEGIQCAILERFFNPKEGFSISEGLKYSRERASQLRKYLRRYFQAGKTARKNAIFIGVER
jgi:hypothetical protein